MCRRPWVFTCSVLYLLPALRFKTKDFQMYSRWDAVEPLAEPGRQKPSASLHSPCFLTFRSPHSTPLSALQQIALGQGRVATIPTACGSLGAEGNAHQFWSPHWEVVRCRMEQQGQLPENSDHRAINKLCPDLRTLVFLDLDTCPDS